MVQGDGAISTSIVHSRKLGECHSAIVVLEQLLECLGGLQGRFRPGEKVLIKPNFVAPFSAATTDLVFIEFFVNMIHKAGGEPVVVEASGFEFDTEKTLTILGVRPFLDRLGVNFLNVEDAEVAQIELAPGLPTLKIARIALDVSLIINLPVLKGHTITKATGAVKNLFGLLDKPSRRAAHCRQLNRIIAALPRKLPHTLHFVDARQQLTRAVFGQTRPLGYMLAGEDPFALDHFGCTLLGIDPAAVGHLGQAPQYRVEGDSFEHTGLLSTKGGIKLGIHRGLCQFFYLLDEWIGRLHGGDSVIPHLHWWLGVHPVLGSVRRDQLPGIAKLCRVGAISVEQRRIDKSRCLMVRCLQCYRESAPGSIHLAGFGAGARTRLCLNTGGLSGNKGDHAILGSIQSTVKRLLPHAELRILPVLPGGHDLWTFPLACLRARVLIVGGGQMLRDETSALVPLLIGMRVMMGKLLGARVLIYGIGAGPLVTRLGRWAVKHLVARADRICLRDHESADLLRRVGVPPGRIVITADPALNFEPAPPNEIDRECHRQGLTMDLETLVIAVRRAFCYSGQIVPVKFRRRMGLRVANSERQQAFESSMARIADRMIEESGVRVVFLAMSPSPNGVPREALDDDVICRRVIHQMRHRNRTAMIDPDTPPDLIKGLLSQVGLVASMRMHAAILAAGVETPAVGLAISPKMKAFFGRLNRERFVINVEDEACREEDILDLIREAWRGRVEDRLALTKHVARLRNEERKNGQILAELLKMDRI